MKKIILISVLFFTALEAVAQPPERMNAADSSSEHMSLHASVSFGQDYFSNNFFVNTFGADYQRQLDNKTAIYFGANVFNINIARELSDRSPRNRNSASLYFGATYSPNDKLTVGGSVFYNGLFNEAGANVNLLYQFSQDSWLEISATFSRRLFTPSYNQTVPYWYNEAFHPFIMGY